MDPREGIIVTAEGLVKKTRRMSAMPETIEGCKRNGEDGLYPERKR